MTKYSETCHCWRCARPIPHRAQEHPVCDCGAALGEPGTVTLCTDDLNRLDDASFNEHIAARKALESRRDVRAS